MLTLGPQITLDRMSPKRSDAAWVASKLAERATRLMVMIDLKPVVEQTGIGETPDERRGTVRWFTLDQIRGLGIDTGEAMFLGQDAEGRGFPEWLQVDAKELKGTFKALPARSELPATINESLVVELYSR